VPQQLAQQRGVLGADAALQRLPQRRELGPQATLGQHRRVVGSCDQAVPHRPAGDAQHVGGDRAQRDPASSKTCCSRWASRVRSQSSALRSRVRSRSSRIGWWHQPGSDQAVGDQLADRHRGGHIGLGAGHGAQVGGLQQPAPAVVFQQDRQRPPGHPGRLHPNHRDRVAGRPVTQQHQPGRGRPNRPCRLQPTPDGSGTPTVAVTLALSTSRPAHRSMSSSTAAPSQGRRQRCHPEAPHPAASEVRAHSNSPGCPRLLRPPLDRAHDTKLRPRHQPTAPCSSARVGVRAHEDS